jgi:predicted TIM-barrel fold metal-dependent hydrolase
MIVDCHTHLNRYTPETPSSLRERHAQLRAEMDANGIDYALVLSSYAVNEDRPSTEHILDVVRDDPRIGVVAGVSYHYRARDLAQLRGLLEGGRIKGLKLYPGYEEFYVHDARLRVVYEMAAEFGVPVMIHTGDTYDASSKVKFAHPLEVDEAAVTFPDVTFVMCHLGNPWFADAMEVIYKNGNVLGDISGFTLGNFEPRFEQFIRGKLHDVIAFINDPEMLMFGSDWPISGLPSYLRFAQTIDATPEELEGLLWRNADRVFKLGLGEAQAEAGSD